MTEAERFMKNLGTLKAYLKDNIDKECWVLQYPESARVFLDENYDLLTEGVKVEAMNVEGQYGIYGSDFAELTLKDLNKLLLQGLSKERIKLSKKQDGVCE